MKQRSEQERTSILQRMVDVGFALRLADDNNQWLSRVQLQKYIYLVDVLRPTFQAMPPIAGHYTYRYGPYDPRIQNAADVLAFRGFLRYAEIQHELTFGKKRSILVYQLTQIGNRWVEKLRDSGEFSITWQISTQISHWLEVLGWKRIVKLVYSEPTFNSVRYKGFGQKLAVYDGTENTAAFVMALIDYALLQGQRESSSDRISSEQMTEYFFKYLDKYETITSQSDTLKMEE